MDAGFWRGLREHVSTTEEDGGFHAKRLDELSQPKADKAWLWGANPIHGNTIADQEEYKEAVRLMLGTGGPQVPTLCRYCGECTLDTGGVHASKCAKGQATKRHNKIAKVIHAFAQKIDPDAETEPENLVASKPKDRPADVLTAADGRLSAFDIGVTSVDQGCSGGDAADKMFNKKKSEREGIRAELSAQGISYVPLTMSGFGTMHSQMDDTVKKIAKNVARSKGWKIRAVERQLRSRIHTAMWKGNARMSLATWYKDDVNIDDIDIEIKSEVGDEQTWQHWEEWKDWDGCVHCSGEEDEDDEETEGVT